MSRALDGARAATERDEQTFLEDDCSMSVWAILGVAVALAMDAFSVSVAAGIALPVVTGRHVFRLAWHFGLFQFFMPIIGWAAGRAAVGWVQAYDHWIAFGLLAFIGAKMVYESLAGRPPDERGDPTRGASLVLLSIATSIDALAVGVSLAMLRVPIVFPSVVIGLVCGLLSMVGVRLGRKVGLLVGKRIELAGGLALIAIGVKILIAC